MATGEIGGVTMKMEVGRITEKELVLLSIAIIALVTSSWNPVVEAFVTSSTCRFSRGWNDRIMDNMENSVSSSLHLRLHGEDGNTDDDEDDDEVDMAEARRQLENLMGIGGKEDDGDKSSNNIRPKLTKNKRRRRSRLPHALRLSEHSPPPLTTIMRERREAEIQLLESLQYGDAGMSDLWSLWFAERGPEAATKLLEIEALCSKGEDFWSEAEDKLLQIIKEYGPYWAEPVNRLATLYYMQGRMEESKALCEVVLTLKPWHVGALSGIVLVCAGLGDVGGARMWADRRLPPLQPDNTTGGRRTKWVKIFVAEAKAKLGRAEKDTFRPNKKEDEQEKIMRNQSKNTGLDRDFEEEAWQ